MPSLHFKCGQAAKTGTGGHLPGHKADPAIAAVRGLQVGEAAVSPARFTDWQSLDDYRFFADEVRAATGGIPIGVKLSAQDIEADIDAALAIGVDYRRDGRGGERARRQHPSRSYFVPDPGLGPCASSSGRRRARPRGQSDHHGWSAQRPITAKR